VARPPTQETRPPPTAIPTADAPLTPSKSQRKRDAHALQTLGIQLVALSIAQLARLDLPETLHEAVVTVPVPDTCHLRAAPLGGPEERMMASWPLPLRITLTAPVRERRLHAGCGPPGERRRV
jgi:hypothetical protein